MRALCSVLLVLFLSSSGGGAATMRRNPMVTHNSPPTIRWSVVIPPTIGYLPVPQIIGVRRHLLLNDVTGAIPFRRNLSY